MAEIKTLGGIASISGKLGNYQFRTMKSTGKVFMHLAPSVQQPYRKPKPPTPAQQTQKQRFAAIANMVRQMMALGSKKTRKQLWKIATAAYDAANK